MTALNQIAELIKASIGVDAETIGRLSLTNAVRSRMKACGLTEIPDYCQQLSHSGEELTQLVELVVVPETWFFRAPEAFAALVRMVLRDWLPAHPDGRLRVLSAPCSTGEEPYTIAMALLDAGLEPERFQVDAIDISGGALERARRAVYGRNSFRGDNLDFRARYFSEVAGGYQLNAAVKERVRLRQGNLVADESFPGMGIYDAIFCRNVLIYFDSPTQERVLANLTRHLTAEGLLFVGPSETFVARSAGFSGVDFPGAFVCRRSSQKAVPPLAPAPLWLPSFVAPSFSPPVKAPVKPGLPKTVPVRETLPATAAVPSAPPVIAKVSADAALESATNLANAGRLSEAFALVEAWLREHRPSAEAYYLLGLIRDTQGAAQEAAGHYRKALYLEPEHQDALLHLALLMETQGDAEGARRLRARARRSEEVPRP